MRKGYWKILLRSLRSRIASGLDSFSSHDICLTLTEVLASDDDALEPASVLPLAATASGAILFIDTVNSLVLLQVDDEAHAEPTGLDFPAFIDALAVRNAGAPDMEWSLGDAELPDLSLPQRKPWIGD